MILKDGTIVICPDHQTISERILEPMRTQIYMPWIGHRQLSDFTIIKELLASIIALDISKRSIGSPRLILKAELKRFPFRYRSEPRPSGECSLFNLCLKVVEGRHYITSKSLMGIQIVRLDEEAFITDWSGSVTRFELWSKPERYGPIEPPTTEDMGQIEFL